MATDLERQTTELADSYIAGNMSRRTFVVRLLALGLSTGAVGAIVAACGAAVSPSAPPAATGSSPSPAPSATAGEEPAALTVWKSPHNPGDQDFFTKKYAEFGRDHPGISATHRVIPWEALTETLTAAYLGNTPPDLVYLPMSFYPKYALAGSTTDLQGVAGAQLTELAGQFQPDVWKFGQLNGTQYGFPFIKAGVVLAWNRKLFSEVGLDPDVKPATWAELRTFAQKLTKKDASGRATQWGYGIMDNSENFMVNFVPIPSVNYGGEFTTADDKQWVFNGPGHVEGLQLQVDIMRTDQSAPPFGTFVGTEINKAFLDGRIAMMLSYASFLEPLRKDFPNFDIGVDRPPSGPANDFTIGAAGYWLLAEKSKAKAAALELAKFLSSGPVQTEYTQLSRLSPTRDDIDPFSGDTWMEAFVEADRGYVRQPFLPFDVWQLLMPEMETALLGEKTAQEALDTAADRINQRIQEGS